MSPGPTQLIIILVIVLLLFGAKKIPELAKGLGTGMREFRQGASGELEDDDKDNKDKNQESKSDEDTSSESPDDVRSEDGSSDEARKSQKTDKTEQRS